MLPTYEQEQAKKQYDNGLFRYEEEYDNDGLTEKQRASERLTHQVLLREERGLVW
jgi:hypothetical protein